MADENEVMAADRPEVGAGDAVAGSSGAGMSQEDTNEVTTPLRKEERAMSSSDKSEVTWPGLLWSILAVIFMCGDHLCDVVRIIYYLILGEYWYFGINLTFTVFPGLFVSMLSLKWYSMDGEQVQGWLSRASHMLLIAPLARSWESFTKGWKSLHAESDKEKGDLTKAMRELDSDAAVLRLLEACMESAPQFVLQLYIVMVDQPPSDSFLYVASRLSIVVAASALGISLASYHRALRFPQADKGNISNKAMLLQFFFHLCLTSSRVLALALFAVYYSWYMVLVCAVHWFFATVWITRQNLGNFDKKFWQFLFNVGMGFAYIFALINIKDNPTLKRTIVYHAVCFVQNSAMVLIWFLLCDCFCALYWTLFFVHFLLFFLGILLMYTYYLFFHPNVAIMQEVAGMQIDCVPKRSSVQK